MKNLLDEIEKRYNRIYQDVSNDLCKSIAISETIHAVYDLPHYLNEIKCNCHICVTERVYDTNHDSLMLSLIEESINEIEKNIADKNTVKHHCSLIIDSINQIR